jgi:hypothetical protein
MENIHNIENIENNIDNNKENDNENDDLDISWIHQQERIQNIQSNYYREPMDCINTFFIYINQNQYIDKILCEKYDLEIVPDGGSQLNKETLLRIIQTKKIKTNYSKYKLIDILQYHIELEPEHIQSFINNGEPEESSQKLLKNISVFDEIRFSPSIFIFHGINSLYFLFQEVETIKQNLRKSVKSILKSENREHFKKGTKKVKISTETIEYSDNYNKNNDKNKTRKIIR